MIKMGFKKKASETNLSNKNIKCYICDGKNLSIILDKKKINLWTGFDDTDKNRENMFSCKLYQCLNCGHIQHHINNKLEKVLMGIYESKKAQLSTLTGVGALGEKRADNIFNELDLSNKKTALEIGCAQGHLLEYLKTKGFTDLMGIDPSIKENYTKGDIKFIKGYVNSELNLKKKFDLIFSIAVFEHIQNISSTMKFISNHLKDDGTLFIFIPNCEPQLKNGDPGIFTHEHIHYFTLSSLQFLFEKEGFQIRKIKEVGGAYLITIGKIVNKLNPLELVLFKDYELKLNAILKNIKEISYKKHIAFHGACNSLNNMIGWGEINKDFGLFDNDERKIGEKYFNRIVEKPTKQAIDQYEQIIIIPTEFFDEIKKKYQELGFEGEIIGAVNASEITCPICAGYAEIFYTNKKQPIFTQGLLPEKIIETSKLSIAVCHECSYVFSSLRDISKLKEVYNKYYGYLPSNLSQLDIDYKKELSEYISEKCSVGTALEIGSHDGYFLNLLSEKGFDCTGIDPSPISNTVLSKYRLKIIKDFFPSKILKDKKFDLVIIRHVLEHVNDPLLFFNEINKVLNKDKMIFVEVPNIDFIIEKKNYQDFFFEHLSYFSKNRLELLMYNSGFEIIESNTLRESRVIGVLAKKKTGKHQVSVKSDKQLIANLKVLGKGINNFKKEILDFLNTIILPKYKLVIWGAGSSGICLSNLLGLDEKNVSFAVDNDVKKWGKYFPGNGIVVKSPEVLKYSDVKFIFIISDLYQNEIRKSLDWFVNSGGRVIGFDPEIGYLK